MIFRIQKTNNYTTINNHVFRNNRLSWKAKGLLAEMLSMPNDWQFSIQELIQRAKDGRDSVYSAISELEGERYLWRVRTTNEKGQFTGYDYNVYEIPWGTLPNMEKPDTENPYPEKPYTENPTLLNTNSTKDYISPNGDRESISPILFEEENNSITTPYSPPSLTESERTFDEFRRAYKGTKRGLRTEFDNFRKKHKDWHDVLQHLLTDYENQEKLREENRKAGAFVPQPKNLSTYINQRCWEEEITPAEQKQNAYGNTINREAARLQAGVSCIRAGLNSANAERNPFEGVQG